MELKQRITAFVQFGQLLKHISEGNTWPGYDCGLNQQEYDDLIELLPSIKHHNAWFTESSISLALKGISYMLEEHALQTWMGKYNMSTNENRIGIIMAGNIPFVGFHDLLCVLICGHKAIVKLSSDDALLPKALIGALQIIEPEFDTRISFSDRKLADYDAIIATGSNNSARYFHQYFGHVPNIIRKNRTSIAILDGTETKDQLIGLGHDIFDFFGLGCRNVSKIFVPKAYDLDTFFGGIYDFGDIINHNKYCNNFDYHKAVYLMNQDVFLENGFLMLKEDEGLHSPLSVLYYQRYELLSDVQEFISKHADEVQCVVSQQHIPFGYAQSPGLDEYADNVDTIQFLS